jgi:ABC-2 type transport system permease protein
MMHGWLKLTWIETKLFVREPIALFFTLVYATLLLLVFGSMFGNTPELVYAGHGNIDASVPDYMAVVISFNALFSLVITVVGYRERGVLRRFQATPIRPEALLVSQLIVNFLMTALGALLLIVVGKAVFGLHFFGNPLSVLAAFVLCTLSLFALGLLLASLAPSVRIAMIVGLVLVIFMFFLSGATFPMYFFPPALKQIAEFLPLTHAVSLLQGLWFGDAWGAHLTDVLVLAACLVVGAVVSARVFRWR